MFQLYFGFSILVFYFLVLSTMFWRKIFSIKILTIIGGMCYTIYMIHYILINATGKFISRVQFTNWYLVDWFIITSVMIAVILFFSGIFFVLIERPCMIRNWPTLLYNKIKRTILASINR